MLDRHGYGVLCGATSFVSTGPMPGLLPRPWRALCYRACHARFTRKMLAERQHDEEVLPHAEAL
eukprot:4890444-Alexandrium_andersonii.AAC.1